MVAATSPKVTITMYSDLPAGQIGLSQMWSGDIINAVNYRPGTKPDILRYWFPADGKGLVDNDLMVLLRGGRNPVLGHLFVNHMLDTEMAKLNFKQIGYQPPQNSLNGYARRRRAGPGEPQERYRAPRVLRRRLPDPRTRRGQ